MVGNLTDGRVRDRFRMLVRLLHSVGVAGPAGSECDETLALEQLGPPLPARRQEPETVDEDDRGRRRRVRALDLLGLAFGERLGLDGWHRILLCEVEDFCTERYTIADGSPTQVRHRRSARSRR